MRFIVDKALSPKVALYLNDNNHEAILVDEFASIPPVEDVVIFEYAIQNNFTVITADVDYGQLLALTKNDDSITGLSCNLPDYLSDLYHQIY